MWKCHWTHKDIIQCRIDNVESHQVYIDEENGTMRQQDPADDEEGNNNKAGIIEQIPIILQKKTK